MEFAARYLAQVADLAREIDPQSIRSMVDQLVQLRQRNGRLFLLGVGGSAANCSHAVNDFRKLAGIEAYAPTDNVSELTARTNDEGWEGVFSAWLNTSRANSNDAVMVFSVGGGNVEHGVSMNIVRALEEAQRREMTILGIVSRDGGYTKQVGDHVIVIPTIDPALVTPHAESFQAVVWHAIVSHPEVLQADFKWESVK